MFSDVMLPLAFYLLPSIECKMNLETFLSADACILYLAFMKNVT